MDERDVPVASHRTTRQLRHCKRLPARGDALRLTPSGGALKAAQQRVQLLDEASEGLLAPTRPFDADKVLACFVPYARHTHAHNSASCEDS